MAANWLGTGLTGFVTNLELKGHFYILGVFYIISYKIRDTRSDNFFKSLLHIKGYLKKELAF